MKGDGLLLPHCDEWEAEAKDCIKTLESILGSTAVSIEHIGSTAISGICAKPIIDIAVGVRDIEDVMPYQDALKVHGISFHGQDIPGQLLFVIGHDGLRTHHIHVTGFDGDAWNNYIAFRDYLRTFPGKAREYEEEKLRLARLYKDDRKSYTASKADIIGRLIQEARRWKAQA